MRCFLLGLCLISLTSVAGNHGDQPNSKNTLSPEQYKAMAEMMTQRLRQFYPAKRLAEGTYVGSEFCIACHTDQAGWRDTKHAQALRRPMAQYSMVAGQGVVADNDQNGMDDFMQGLDFNQIDSVFDPFKPNAPVLSYNEGQYFISIGQNTMPVVCTQGGTGDWKQRYLLRVPVADSPDGYSRENYVSPIQFNEVTHEYVLYHPEAWYDDENQPRFGSNATLSMVAEQNGRTYSKKCIGCHTTGIRDLGQDPSGEWRYRPFPAALFHEDDPSYFDYDHDGISDIVNIGCEACHGPGSPHILAAGNPEKILNPADLDTPQANEVCGQCHSRVSSVPDGVHGFPYNETEQRQFIPGAGEPLAAFFTDSSGRWPDGINSRQHHQQYLDFLESSKPGFQFHPVKCVECHSSHGESANRHQIRDVIVDEGLEIPTSNYNDTLCLACHATHGDFEGITKEMVADFDTHRTEIGEVVSAHTKHPFAPERRMGLSRCSSCHNPVIAKSAINYDIHSHTFEVIAPEKTLAYQDEGGMPNACAVSCHANKVDSFSLGLDGNISSWDDDHDIDLAFELMKYFGPDGIWWDHSIDDAQEGEK